ncbi:MAG: hypothetical protein ACTSYD_01620 [Candidatus Heimdallarchaeaceae archaeon]
MTVSQSPARETAHDDILALISSVNDVGKTGVVRNIAQKIRFYVDKIKGILSDYPDSFARRKIEILAENLLIAE